ncbi:malonyl-ACP O-methyltransferase BioC [Flammeovirga sp. SubArs3]|uniref:malonyl-ACP O-methyltransferase BioC n=1 Tax=Flammeovirga sp. SubArs3 TaxID=2995316 RepID=UPI00248CE2CF|nr:malonyl-ACP O-methyltransferase BioC [Flammeovirga sp. SubArs3]
MVINKEIVAQRFGKNVSTYNTEAFIQKRICKELYRKLISVKDSYNSVFEIGCGTGFLSKQAIPHVSDTYFANDLGVSCTHQLLKDYPSINFIEGDAENVKYPERLDLVLSSSAFQWMTDRERLLKRINQSLNKDGLLAFSTFGPSNFEELKTTLNEGLEYGTLTHWRKLTEEAGFEVLSAWEWKTQLIFSQGTDVLKHIKKTGVGGCANANSIWTKSKLIAFNDKYQSHFPKENGVQLTYHPIFIIAKKK